MALLGVELAMTGVELAVTGVEMATGAESAVLIMSGVPPTVTVGVELDVTVITVVGSTVEEAL